MTPGAILVSASLIGAAYGALAEPAAWLEGALTGGCVFLGLGCFIVALAWLLNGGAW